MALGGFNCPWCRHYNANSETRCGRCDKWLPPRAIAPLVARLRAEKMWATKLIGGICVLVYAMEMAASGGKLALMGGLPMSTLVRFGAIAGGLEHHEPWRYLSACFVHFGILHIAMNVISLADLGRVGEELVGGARFLLTFVITGVLGFIVSTWWYTHTGDREGPFTAGASGGVFGVVGMILGDLIAKKDPRWKGMLVRTLIYSVVFYFMLGTNQAAHMGGLAIGIVLGVLFKFESRPWRIAWLVGSLSVISVIAIVVSLVLPYFSPVWRAIDEAERAERDAIHAPGE